MASVNSFPILSRDWEGLMSACREHPEIAALAEPFRVELDGVLLAGKALADRQASLQAQRQRATQELKDVVARGKELARRLRRIAPFQLGTDNEQLVQFSVKPRRRRIGRKKGTEVTPPPPAGGSPETPAVKPVG
jgi:hypothetical protein